jgi:hypothetical protein
MARGSGTSRSLSEGDVSKLIRGDTEALKKQAATGGNTKPTPANPTPSPNPAPTPAAQPTTPTPAAQPTPATQPTPASTPTTPSSQPSASPTSPTSPNPAANPAAKPKKNPKKNPNNDDEEEEEGKEPEKRYVIRDKKGSAFNFGGGSGFIEEGGGERASEVSREAVESALQKAKKKARPIKPATPPKK